MMVIMSIKLIIPVSHSEKCLILKAPSIREKTRKRNYLINSFSGYIAGSMSKRSNDSPFKGASFEVYIIFLALRIVKL